jgi:hypothetical protein
MCGALCWMLQAWVSGGWALAGGLLAAIRFGIFSYWMNSYFGGAMAAIGGALVLGALPRIVSRRDWRDPVLMGVGIATLANSRPYEGFVLALPALIALCVWTARHRDRARQVLLPMLDPGRGGRRGWDIISAASPEVRCCCHTALPLHNHDGPAFHLAIPASQRSIGIACCASLCGLGNGCYRSQRQSPASGGSTSKTWWRFYQGVTVSHFLRHPF